MFIDGSKLKACIVALSLLGAHTASGAMDSMSLEFGTGNKTKLARVGAQWQWQRQWWQSNGTHIGGYWDLSLAYWRGTQFQGISDRTQDIASIGITPVFRFQRNDYKGFYAEAGIGAHLLSDLYDNNGRRLSTSFQFGDHLAVGYVFENQLDLGIKFQHFSNASIKRPNHGVNFAIVRVSYPF